MKTYILPIQDARVAGNRENLWRYPDTIDGVPKVFVTSRYGLLISSGIAIESSPILEVSFGISGGSSSELFPITEVPLFSSLVSYKVIWLPNCDNMQCIFPGQDISFNIETALAATTCLIAPILEGYEVGM